MKIRSLVLLAVLSASSLPAAAQDWPTRPIQIVVSSGAGGTADIIARLIAEQLSPALGQPVVVENRPGAGGHVGAAAVARAKPDGYTLLMSGSPTHSVGPHMFKSLSYDPMRDVPPLAMVAIAPNLLVVNASLPIKSVKELVQYAREHPGRLTYSSAGAGTSGFLAAELLKKSASLDMSHVPYKSGPEAVTGVLSGDVGFIFFTLPSVLPQVEAGKLRALAITGAERSPLIPNVPTVAEAGFSDYEVLAWYALCVPRDMPQPIVDKLSKEIEKIVNQPEMRAKMAQLGAEPRFMNSAQVAKFVANESPKWGELLKEFSGAAK